MIWIVWRTCPQYFTCQLFAFKSKADALKKLAEIEGSEVDLGEDIYGNRDVTSVTCGIWEVPHSASQAGICRNITAICTDGAEICTD